MNRIVNSTLASLASSCAGVMGGSYTVKPPGVDDGNHPGAVRTEFNLK